MRRKSIRDKNGFTVIELILSFAFVSAIAAALFGAVVNYRDKEERTTVETRLISFKNRMTLEIQKDIEMKMLNSIEYCRDEADNIINRCVIFNFLDGTSKRLKTEFEEEHDEYGSDDFTYLVPYLLYGDLKFEIPDAIDIDVDTGYMLSYTTAEDALENNTGLYNLSVSFTHMKYDIKFDINIIATGLTPFTPGTKTYEAYTFGERVGVQVNDEQQLPFYVLHNSDEKNARVVLIADFEETRRKFNNTTEDGNKYETSGIRNYLENTVYYRWTCLENKNSIRLATFEEMAYINAVCPDIRDRGDENIIHLDGSYQPVLAGDFWLMTDYYTPGSDTRVWVCYEDKYSHNQMFDNAEVDSDFTDSHDVTYYGYGVKPVIEVRKEYVLGRCTNYGYNSPCW